MKEHFRRRRLPHLDKPDAIYFVTSCLEGSVPALGLLDIANYKQSLALRNKSLQISDQEWRVQKWKLEFAKSDEWLDRSLAVRHLENAELAETVEQALLHFAGEQFAIWAWVVKPNHFHWVFEPQAQWVEKLGGAADDRTPRERIMHSIKRHSGRQCNQWLGKSGAFWQDESYDHCVRDIEELDRIIQYVEQNPVKAGLATEAHEYRFSSARYRKSNEIPYGQPLIGETQLTAFG
jgi:putative transposase